MTLEELRIDAPRSVKSGPDAAPGRRTTKRGSLSKFPYTRPAELPLRGMCSGVIGVRYGPPTPVDKPPCG